MDNDYIHEDYEIESFPENVITKHHYDIVVKFWLLNNLLSPSDKFEVLTRLVLKARVVLFHVVLTNKNFFLTEQHLVARSAQLQGTVIILENERDPILFSRLNIIKGLFFG